MRESSRSIRHSERLTTSPIISYIRLLYSKCLVDPGGQPSSMKRLPGGTTPLLLRHLTRRHNVTRSLNPNLLPKATGVTMTSPERRARSQFSALVVLVLSSACQPPKDYCPRNLDGVKDPDGSSLAWGGHPPKVSADIERVAVECVAQGLPSTEAERAVRGSRSAYLIAATATIRQYLPDQKWFSLLPASTAANFEDEIEFEAVSTKGVVLASTRGKFRVVAGDTVLRLTVSGQMEGLSGEEAARVATVRARWTYGRR